MIMQKSMYENDQDNFFTVTFKKDTYSPTTIDNFNWILFRMKQKLLKFIFIFNIISLKSVHLFQIPNTA